MWKLFAALFLPCYVTSFAQTHDHTQDHTHYHHHVHHHHRSHETSDNPIVTAPAGTVKGSMMTSRLGKPIYSFRGIRYAEPPVGELRFKPPVPHKWNGTFDATDDGPVCYQATEVLQNRTSEDCLRINVYTPKLPNGDQRPKQPVIVFLHPGGFYSDSGISIHRGPEYFVDQDIVLVTLNYRLGTLGFLSTGDAEAPGNNGLKDQVVALKWVQDNIEAFGGDKDSVTLLGLSAGSWTIELLLVSPMSPGLFHKAIAMSGSVLGPWKLPQDQMDIAKQQASFVGCPNDSARKIIDCLKTKPAAEIANSIGEFRIIDYDPILIWSPVIEKDFGQERFLTDDPIKLIKQGNFLKMPFMTGTAKNEFDWKAFQIIYNDTAREMYNSDFEKYAPVSFLYERDTPKSKEISRAIRKYYLEDKPLTNDSIIGFAKLYTDSIEGFPINRAAKLIAENSDKPVYYYQTTYLGRYGGFYKPGTNNTVPYGVVHHDELIYLFTNKEFYPFFDDSYPEARTVSKLTTAWANFAKTGNPIPKTSELFDNANWDIFNLQTQKYMDIGEKMVMKDKMFEERYSVWERLFPL